MYSTLSDISKSRHYPEKGKATLAELQLGAIQRIADALEKISGHLDLDKRKERKEKKAREEAIEKVSTLVVAELGKITDKMRPILSHAVDNKDRESVRTISDKVELFFRRRHLVGLTEEGYADYDVKKLSNDIDSFDVLTFNFDKLRIGPVCKSRFMPLLARYREADQANKNRAGAPDPAT